MVTKLLAHYWTADEPMAVRQAQIEDWIGDLGEFSTAAIATACDDWRRSSNRRPTPADIRGIIIEATAYARETERMAVEAADQWPKWLVDIWGPAPDGPRKRAEFIAAAHQRRLP